MFILSLRGKFGSTIALRLHLFSIALTIVLFSFSILVLQVAAVAAFLAGSYLTLRYMDRNKEKLIFNSEANRQFAYPSISDAEKWFAYFQWSLAIIFFTGGIWLALSDVDEIAAPTGLIAATFFVGCLAVIDIIHRLTRKRDS
ncbi:hypothetical protein [Meridianimarinicoccus aquatilis]|uniref:Uncharacterized protein n=1 Tax=Meridianimarinicoccus aquatilis TaxID=2552766 RepID=A0A4R6AQ32_9RHOB|nr:hypothetical protein [Fluviibacterium aquatile]TDL83783.1 hypothetical protein E2L05_19305 [Fluviibacterium aquatile]